jgi:predicted alpha/beta-fold hydrolase
MIQPIPTSCSPQTPFMPAFLLRNPHLQTILASLRIRALGANPLRQRSEEILVDAGSGVRLLGYHTVHPGGRRHGLVIMLNG